MQRAMSLREFAALDLKPTPLPVLLGMIKMDVTYEPPRLQTPKGDVALISKDKVEERLLKVGDKFTAGDIVKTSFIGRSAANYIVRSAVEYGLAKLVKHNQARGHTYEKVKP